MKGPRLKMHHGGIVFVSARIYATVSGCEPNGSDEHFVHVYDATSLELIGVHDVRGVLGVRSLFGKGRSGTEGT